MTEQDPTAEQRLLEQARTGHSLTTEQAAVYTGMAVNTLNRWRWSGHGPRYRKLGRSVRYLRSDLDAWLDRCATGSTSQPGAAG